MFIENGRILLKPFELEHLRDPAYHSWLCDLQVVKYIGRDELLKSIPFEDVEKYVRELWKNTNCHFFAIHDAETDKFIGTSKANFVSTKSQKDGIADIGIMLGERSFWGRGLAVEVLQAISTFAFDNLRARKLTAGGYSANIAVIKAFLKVGYSIEGTLRQQLSLDGGYCDHILMGCFESELLRPAFTSSFRVFNK
jgi:ribosomal-protein-alanine N-acetyltransferase